MTEGFIPPHGGYQGLLSFRKARIIYDGTQLFCRRFLNRRDRTVDQMVQAARSGKQNTRAEQGFRHIERDRDKTHGRSPGEPGGAA